MILTGTSNTLPERVGIMNIEGLRVIFRPNVLKTLTDNLNKSFDKYRYINVRKYIL